MTSKREFNFGKHYNDFAEHNNECSKKDLEMIISTIEKDELSTRIYKIKDGFILKLYSPKELITISSIVPILTNLDFNVLTEDTFEVVSDKSIYFMHRYLFKLNNNFDCDISDSDVSSFINKIIISSFQNKISNISLNKISYLGKIDFRYVQLLMTYITYCKQIKFTIDNNTIISLLEKNYILTLAIIDLFIAKFSTNNIKKNKVNIEEQQNKINDLLLKIKNPTLEKVIKMMFNLVNATVRTNFYLNKSFISIKIKTELLNLSFKPVSFADVFVFSEDFEAIHIRNSSVSRGGIRWSDRADDYRTEVFGLAKTQLAKNSIIVPSGSKGGFYIKKPFTDKNFVVECYKNFLKGILDITDNIVNDKVVHPKIAIYDDEDPYLVVAADKGTATFSDYANDVSEEYGFWIKDAFASGGKNGYDHKKLAITARGTWESVKRHLLELNLDIDKDTIKTIGIGGMMGDVFGNGALYSKNIQLVAVFNQDHIFLDPNPNLEKSYAERLRMFNALEGWDKYDEKLLSKGGAIYNRNDNHIILSKEIIEMLEITTEEHKKSITGDELIKYILKSNVDLLFNGGIGTFIKSESESDNDVSDKSNDNIRINGNEIGAKVIGEGGNLGMTQLGRIEYALFGGKCNTDAIDNSAGVSCSDHEVNIKIALNKAVDDEYITLSKRNKALDAMEEDVSKMVLLDNFLQTKIISIEETFNRGPSVLKYINLITTLENDGLLKRKNECLPNGQEIANRSLTNASLFKPELSVLLSYSKIYIKNKALETNISDHPYCSDYLYNYFPSLMREKFKDYILNHKLKKDIIITSLVNEFVNLLGSSAFIDIQNITSASVDNILKAYLSVKKVFNLDELINNINNLDSSVPLHTKYSAQYLISQNVIKNICNMLSLFSDYINDQNAIESFVLTGSELDKTYSSMSKEPNNYYCNQNDIIYLNTNLPQNINNKLTELNKFRGIIPISIIANINKISVINSIIIYNEIDKIMSLQTIKCLISVGKMKKYWDWIATMKALQSISVLHIEIVNYLVANKENSKYFANKCQKSLLSYNAMVNKLKTENADILAMSMLIIESVNVIKKELQNK